jgi:D-beta-D-heptose 7-phosphate kinase / D-beta-D-heptose 1-phosphate adenosyltransferase
MKVFTNGCFDILHKGHIELLAYCKSLGHVTVGLNSDDSVKRLKGLSRPMNTESDRKRILEAIRYVDEVVIFGEDTPYELLLKLKPDVIVKGGDYIAHDVIGSELCEVRIFETVDGYSTTNIINRMVER